MPRVRAVVRWLDQRPWLVVVLGFVLTEAVQLIAAATASTPVLLAAANASTRGEVYSSLAESSGSLLGFSIAAVAVLITFSARRDPPERPGQEQQLVRARRRLVAALLGTSAVLGLNLVLATVALAVDAADAGVVWLSQLVTSVSVASAVGLGLSGLGFTLALLQRAV